MNVRSLDHPVGHGDCIKPDTIIGEISGLPFEGDVVGISADYHSGQQ